MKDWELVGRMIFDRLTLQQNHLSDMEYKKKKNPEPLLNVYLNP